MPDPSTDKVTRIVDVDRIIEVIQPGAAVKPVRDQNWRFNEKAYDRYKVYLRQAVDNWPNETSFEIPAGLSPNTFCARFRDAIVGLINYGYEPDLQQRVLAIRDQFVVSHDKDDKIWFRAKGNVGRTPRNPKVLVAEKTLRPIFEETKVIQRVLTVDEITSYVNLMRSNLVQGPIVFRGKLDDSIATSLEESLDIAFAYDEATNTTAFLI